MTRSIIALFLLISRDWILHYTKNCSSLKRCGYQILTEEVVQSAWNSTDDLDVGQAALAKVSKYGRDLMWWNKNIFGNVRQELKKMKEQLQKAKNEAIISGENHQICFLKKEINLLLDKEARMWAQCPWLLWATQGDGNTKNFHSRATKQYRKKLIGGIRDDQAVWRVQSKEVSVVLIKYYQDLFSSSRPNGLGAVLDHVHHVIINEMNASLCREFMECEVAAALQQMEPLKAPRPNGMPPLFYQHFWGTIDRDVTSSILSLLNTSILLSPLNHTFIILIPKTNKPEHAHQCRPISLCNAFYKIFSKVLANCLKKFSPLLSLSTN